MDEKFGDFEEIKEKKTEEQELEEQQVPNRIRLPRKREFVGLVVQRLGGNRMEVKSTDGKSRNCRVPGRFKRKFWLRPGDYVLIAPWPDDDNKADIVFQYKKTQALQLKKKGFLDGFEEEF